MDISEARRIIDETIRAYEPEVVVALFSGGNDSLTAVHLASTILGERLNYVAHINTGIGVPETREFVQRTCDAHGWSYLEYRAIDNTYADGTPNPQTYRELVKQWGFPGPSHHTKMFNRLKQYQMERLERDLGVTSKRPVMYITGVRKAESARRSIYVEESQKRGRVVWCAPLTHWTKEDCDRWLDANGISRNPVAQNLCKSGECLCGAFTETIGERRELAYHYPEVEREIADIERDVHAAGFPWNWHERPPKWFIEKRKADKAGQLEMFEAERDETLQQMGYLPLCVRCEAEHDEAQPQPNHGGGDDAAD